MALPALTVRADVEAILGRAIPAGDQPRVDRLIELCSAAVRRTARQTITPVADDTVDLPGTWDEELWLPERPVTAVTSITVDGVLIPSNSYIFNRQGRVFRPRWNAITFSRPRDWGPFGGPNVIVRVVYSHGYAEVPDDVAMVTADMVRSVYVNPDQLTAEAVEDYSVAYARHSSGGPITFGMTEAHKTLIEEAVGQVTPTSIPIVSEQIW